MGRYRNIEIKKDLKGRRYYLNSVYPDIPLSEEDIYVITTGGDRYDTLALQYYNDAGLWWVITRANSTQTPDSLIPNIGSQLRIPGSGRIPAIIANYEALNGIK